MLLSAPILRIVIVVALASHAIAHAVALGGLVGQATGGGSASQVVVRSWLMPGLGPNAAAAAAIPFWIVALLGFLLAALSFWGIIVPHHAWRQIAVVAAIVSTAGIALFAGAWPSSPIGHQNLLNIGVAMTMNVAVLVTQLCLNWPAQTFFGS